MKREKYPIYWHMYLVLPPRMRPGPSGALEIHRPRVHIIWRRAASNRTMEWWDDTIRKWEPCGDRPSTKYMDAHHRRTTRLPKGART